MSKAIAAIVGYWVERGGFELMVEVVPKGHGRGLQPSARIKIRRSGKRPWNFLMVRFSAEHNHEVIDRFPLLVLDTQKDYGAVQGMLYYFVSTDLDRAFVIDPKKAAGVTSHTYSLNGDQVEMAVAPRNNWKVINLWEKGHE